jgi:protein-glucosylgalactosylhydroxylysine glucosidase
MFKRTTRPTVLLLATSLCAFFSCQEKKDASQGIDRYALVSRHNVVLDRPDTLGALSVGNGEFAFTADVSGLQTFYEDYGNGMSLGTQAQWAWHSMPEKEAYSLSEVARNYESCDGSAAPYAIQHSEGRAGEATKYLRANPHRLHLGLVGLILEKENGERVKLGDLADIHQQLDLWSGKIESSYQVEGHPVRVTLYAHQQQDRIAARVESSLISEGRLKIRLDFPYGKDCHVCPGYDWEQADKHQSVLTAPSAQKASIRRTLDSTQYFVHLGWSRGEIKEAKPHQFVLAPSRQQDTFEFTVLFSKDAGSADADFKTTEQNSIRQWEDFWRQGGAVDFSACTDTRAKELERRVILSQYLTKIQCSGSLPPQETGLTMNSWFGKFHLEMHWWHAAHFALWNRTVLLEKSMPWYNAVTAKAKATAQWQGYEGARWQKMTDPYGNESPSGVGAFIIWQQPHPVYFAELLYRSAPGRATLDKYKDLVFNTADFMVSFLKLKEGRYHLCHPLIPAQEIFRATETDDPAYELQYWYYGIGVAQEWRRRLGLEENKKWTDVLNNLAPLVVKDNFYLPNATTPQAYTDGQYRRDHPSVLGAYGFLPLNERIDTAVMNNTLREIMTRWQWETTWGWDYPLIAMTAARLNKPEMALEALLMDAQKNTYLVNGHNYQDNRLRLYLPGNGGLLAAVAMMTAGWDGNTIAAPGFPKNGKWNVRWEGLNPMP